MNETKKCIIFSYGPVPVPEQDKVEGGGLRCWGLAKGLKSHSPDVDVTVAFHESYKKPENTTDFESIHITTWNLSNIKELMQDSDSVIVSYCMGDLSVEVVNSIRADQQLILDCYVPIYVEISARASDDLRGEYDAFHSEVNRWAKVLKRGDIYLCANSNQKRYYQGVLSALGRINPATYNDEPILVVPYGVYEEPPAVTRAPITDILKKEKKSYNKVLWFGAVYPWFDLRMLIDAVNNVNKKIPTKLVIVGAKNPFNAHPDFVRRYDELIEYINKDKETKQNVILQDWIEFNDRANWYLDSDLVISINKTGEENQLAWRTRLVDYIWADLPIITNAGDPLGDELVEAGAAIKLDDISTEGLEESLEKLLKNKKDLGEAKKNLAKVRQKYYWNKVTEPLHGAILSNVRPTDFEKFGLTEAIPDIDQNILSKVLRKGKKIPAYYRKYGLRSTVLAARTVAYRKVLNRGTQSRDKRVVFVSHQLDTTGAPHVLLDLVEEFIKNNKNMPIEFHTFNPAAKINIDKLNKLGITPFLYFSKDTPLSFSKGDVVVLNTVAFSDNVKDSVFSAAERGTVKQIIWYVHEDEPRYIFKQDETNRIKKLLDNNKLKIFVLAKGTRKGYVEYFGEKNIIDQPYRLSIAKKYHVDRHEKDFEKLDFILPGMVGDGRKGQLPLLYAFIEFKRRYYDVSPEKYRDFSLTYIGLGDDFFSRQLLKHTKEGLGGHFKSFKALSHEECLDKIAKANVTLCYSMRESLPLFVYEGMTAGHPILRNDCSGLEEQLIDGKNGYLLDSHDFEQVVQSIESITNKKTTTNKKLQEMSDESRAIARKAEANDYQVIESAIAEAFSS